MGAVRWRGDLGECARGCPGTVSHGHYHRYANPKGSNLERIERYLCYVCRLTLSVMLPHVWLTGPFARNGSKLTPSRNKG